MKLHLLHPPQQQKPTYNKRSFVFSLLKTRLSIRFSHHNRDDENYRSLFFTWLSLFLVLSTVIEIQMLQFVLLNIKWVPWVRETTRKKGSNTNIPAVTLYSCKLCGEMVLATSKVIF